MFHVKHSAEKPLFPETMATGRSEMGNLFFVSYLPFAGVAASYLNELSTHTKTSMFHVKHSRLLQTS